MNFTPELTGVGKYSGEMAEWLTAQGHQVRVITALPYYPDWRVQPGYVSSFSRPCQRSSAPGLDVYRAAIWVPGRPTGLKRVLHLLSFAISSLPLLVRELARRPDIAFVVMPTLVIAPQAALFCRLFGVKSWLHVHDFEIDAAMQLQVLNIGRGSGTLHRLERGLLRAFDRVSTISDGMLDRLLSKAVPKPRCSLFPNWVDLQAMTTPEGPNPVRLELGLTEPDLLVLYAGNMGAKQGLGVLIQAGLQLADTPGIQFLMVGDGSARLALQDQAQGLSGMRWWPLQPKNRLNDLLHAADIHVLPQLGGAADLVMPSKLGPMLASGKLVIGTAEADTELGRVLDAVGLRVQPEDPMALANAIRQAAARPAWRAERGAMGRAYVAAHLDKRTVLAAFEQQCHQLLAA